MCGEDWGISREGTALPQPPVWRVTTVRFMMGIKDNLLTPTFNMF